MSCYHPLNLTKSVGAPLTIKMELIYGISLVLVHTYLASGGSPDSSSPCQPGDTGLLPHPVECHLYYDCGQETILYEILGKNIAECTYPQLFDAETMSCKPYNMVTCGERTERKNGCDYVANQCGISAESSHCRPCYLSFPECQGLPDGPNPILHKLGSPFYAVCQDGRFVKEEQCSMDQATGLPMIFNPELKKCVQIYNKIKK